MDTLKKVLKVIGIIAAIAGIAAGIYFAVKKFLDKKNAEADCEENWETSKKCCETSDDVLEYMVGFDRLRDVITQVTVIERTI